MASLAAEVRSERGNALVDRQPDSAAEAAEVYECVRQ
jgi:hypothetical protein